MAPKDEELPPQGPQTIPQPPAPQGPQTVPPPMGPQTLPQEEDK